MPVRLFRLYQQRRIVNINANIVAAGFLAMVFAAVPVHFSYLVTEDKLAITVIGVVADIVFDVAIYYALHWVANHWKPLRPQ
ncbi:MAG: hypothetical protein KDA28_14005, partial [Phycisphaerales bacterium]|nr:hypothetical protein [Phycisphaerales bacterium]